MLDATNDDPGFLLRFHQCHGSDIQLSNNNTTASRLTPGLGLIFSSHPIKPFQKFILKLAEISNQTKEIVSIGFTSRYPSAIYGHTNGLKIVSLKNQHRIKNKTLCFYYTPRGELYFIVDGKEKGFRKGMSHMETHCWAFIHISNPGTVIEVLNYSALNWSNIALTQVMLHQSRGRNVKLTKNIVSKFDRKLNMSYAFTVNPIRIGEHMIIKIIEMDRQNIGGLVLGLTNRNPSNLEKNLPDDVGLFLMRQGYWIVVNDGSWNFKLNDEISFLVTPDGRMKIWRNNSTLLKEIPVNVSTDLWAFFDIATLKTVEVFSYLSNGLEESQILHDYQVNEGRNDLILSKINKYDNEEESLCVVCYVTSVEAAIYPCGHMVMCYGCAREQWRGVGQGNCPICRVKIRDVLKIYKI